LCVCDNDFSLPATRNKPLTSLADSLRARLGIHSQSASDILCDDGAKNPGENLCERAMSKVREELHPSPPPPLSPATEEREMLA
jgi:hypothetical protein